MPGLHLPTTMVEERVLATSPPDCGLTAGQTVTLNGVAFTWPNAKAGLYNNYQAAGQVFRSQR